MIKPAIRVIALSLISTLFAHSIYGQQAESTTAVQIKNVDDVIDNWTPDQHLFVKGDVGASKEQLDKLESWLDENGPHWTIVLMHNARDEKYVAPDGERFFKLDAVEYALAHRLKNQTEFGNLVQPKTGETSGAIFVLYLVERQFAYYSTDAYDRRGLGQSQWRGKLDREVIRAMRNGDRIIDAVRNTVSMIEGRLETQINQETRNEQLAKARIEREREKYLEGVKSLVTETESSLLPRVEESSRQVRSSFPEAAESDLAKPPIELWRTQLVGFRKDAENPAFKIADLRKSAEFRELKKQLTDVRVEINRFLDSYAAHSSFESMMYPVEARLDAIADHPSGAATKLSAEAYSLLDESRAGHARGELGFAGNIEKAKALIESGEQAIDEIQVQLKKEADRKQLIRRTLVIVAAVLGSLLMGLLWILNIRRRPALRRAHALFEKRAKAVETELAKVETVVARSEPIIGVESDFSANKFKGETLQLGNRVQQQVGNLKMMSTEAQRAIGSCQELLHPSNPIAEAANMFTGARYEHCVNELNGKTLQVPGRLDENGAATESQWMTFDEIFSDLHQRSSRTADDLSSFESSLAAVGGQITLLQKRISEATELEKKLSRASRMDRIFKIPSLFEKLLPRTQRDYDRAVSLADSDPVQVISAIVPEGLRKITEGLSVAIAIDQARETSFEPLENSAQKLKKLGFDNRWIAERMDHLSDRADEIVAQASDRTVSEEATQFTNDLVGLGLRAKRSLELAVEIDNEREPKISALKLRVGEARNTIATKLNIDPTRALREEQYDPDVELEQADKQLQSARAAIDYGGVESAMESLEILEIETNHAANLIDTSLTSLDEFDEAYANRQQSFRELQHKLPTHDSLIQSIKTKYADAALTLRDEEFVAGSWDELEPDNDAPTIEAVMATTKQLIGQVENALSTLNANHQSGRILEAGNSMDLVEDDLGSIHEMLSEINEHHQRIEQLATSNVESLADSMNAIGSLSQELSDNRIQRPTMQHHTDLLDMMENFQRVFQNSAVERDPFGDALAVSDFNDRIEELKQALAVDRYSFEEASRAVGGAESELAASRKLVSESLNDRIPDSGTISQCQDETTRLESELDAMQKRLKIPHDNWEIVNREATHLNSKLGVLNGRLRQQLELAQQAVQILTQAADAVYEAANWRGDYSIVVIGRPGSEELEQARHALANGSYARSIEFSKASKFEASRGIESAKQQVSDHRRELARKAAERRRRQMSSSSFFDSSPSRSSSRSSFGFGSSSSSSRSSRSSSSSSRSSSSSSSSGRSSGFSRSSW